MKKILTAIIVSLAVTSCVTTKFSIKQSHTAFSKDVDHGYYGTNNRISSRTVSGGTHYDDRGVFVDPTVTKSSDRGEILRITLHIANVVDFNSQQGRVNMLGRIDEIAFRYQDGSETTLSAISESDASDDFVKYDTVPKLTSFDIYETAVMVLSKEDYKKIISTKIKSIKITGSKRTVVYNEADITPGFIDNLVRFYKLHINT